MDKRIDFVVAGAQKCGTTALRSFMVQHPEIGMPIRKGEVHFFDKYGAEADAGDYTQYHAFYDDAALAKCTGDVTPVYLYRTECLPRLQAYNPDAKVIILLRDPSARAFSHWSMVVGKGKETRSFPEALDHEAWYLQAFGQHPVYSYVQRGFYDAQIGRLLTLFPARNCLFLKTDDLWHRHDETLARVFRFLGVDPTVRIARGRVHEGQGDTLAPEMRRRLVTVFSDDIQRLEQRLGWDLTAWRSV